MIAAQELLTQALQLPIDDRAMMAHELLRSLETEAVEEGYDEAWEQELIDRVKSFDEGKAETCDWREAHEEIRAKLREKRS